MGYFSRAGVGARRLELALVEPAVKAAPGQKLRMGPLLHDPAVPHDQDQGGVADGGQPVGHHKAGAALHERVKGLLDLQLRAGIDAGGGLVQDQHGRQGHPSNHRKGRG